MNSTDHLHQKGDTICRSTDWTDIAKFFLLNYGLHALTVVSAPGATRLTATIAAVVSICMPSYGVAAALAVLTSLTIRKETELETALRARALCMVIPSEYVTPDRFQTVIPWSRNVHGQYPVKNHEPANKQPGDEEQGSPQTQNPTGESPDRIQMGSPAEDNLLFNDYCLVVVPPSFVVGPLVPQPNPVSRRRPQAPFIRRAIKAFTNIPHKLRDAFRVRHGEVTAPNLASNYSFVKIFAAILQILNGSFELYKARGDQVERFGYASYSLTVIPYVLMSLLNLLASLTVPQYPSMFLVYYRGVRVDEGYRTRVSSRIDDLGITTDATTIITDKEQPSVQTNSVGVNEIVVQESVPKLSSDGSGGFLSIKPAKSTAEEGEDDRNFWWHKEEWKKVERGISGAVGAVYGDCTVKPPDPPSGSMRDRLPMASIGFLGMGVLAAPYIIIDSLTNFEEGRSTLSQRSWIMCWIVIGQVGAGFSSVVMMSTPVRRILKDNRHKIFFIFLAMMFVLSTSSIGGFVVVAQMMLGDTVCTTI